MRIPLGGSNPECTTQAELGHAVSASRRGGCRDHSHRAIRHSRPFRRPVVERACAALFGVRAQIAIVDTGAVSHGRRSRIRVQRDTGVAHQIVLDHTALAKKLSSAVMLEGPRHWHLGARFMREPMYHYDAPQPTATVPFVCPRCAFPMPQWPTLVNSWACFRCSRCSFLWFTAPSRVPRNES